MTNPNCLKCDVNVAIVGRIIDANEQAVLAAGFCDGDSDSKNNDSDVIGLIERSRLHCSEGPTPVKQLIPGALGWLGLKRTILQCSAK